MGKSAIYSNLKWELASFYSYVDCSLAAGFNFVISEREKKGKIAAAAAAAAAARPSQASSFILISF